MFSDKFSAQEPTSISLSIAPVMLSPLALGANFWRFILPTGITSVAALLWQAYLWGHRHGSDRERATETMQIAKKKKEFQEKKNDSYDLIIPLDSVRELLSQGCPVLGYSDAALPLFKNSLKFRVVSVLGLYNTGKSFLQGELFGFHFPQGSLVRTKGLSMKCAEQSRLLIIDSAGNQEPISLESSVIADAVRDKREVEALTKELVADLSDFLIVVVNAITWPEQEFCQTLANRCARRGRQQQLIVVHNMHDIESPEVAKARFCEQVRQCYRGEDVPHLDLVSDVLEFVQSDGRDDAKDIRHYGIANHFSSAGETYNNGAFREIRKIIDSSEKKGSRRCIMQAIQRTGSHMLPQFFYCSGEDDIVSNAMTLEFDEPENRQAAGGGGSAAVLDGGDERPKYLGKFCVNQPKGCEVHLRHRGVVNDLGDLNTKDLVWVPDISISKIRDESGRREWLHVKVEAPGCSREHVSVDDTGDGLLVTINKDLDMDNDEDVEQTRRFGNFTRVFDYRTEHGTFTAPQDLNDIYVENGIVNIRMPKVEARGSLLKATAARRSATSTTSSLAGSTRGGRGSRVPRRATDGSGDEAADARSRRTIRSALGGSTIVTDSSSGSAVFPEGPSRASSS
eukprot:TRINITY_DN26771_c0_g2_i1.p1 TRINITY_DN26771_c0_g2~~TRINITY_DN26771_c0_g2_i1.p1  ORF type:complete len:624 (-),score=95.99 TRINITY_DN26771_c0_g2_i1:295-2166(-)